jgi:O-Antigen ligase
MEEPVARSETLTARAIQAPREVIGEVRSRASSLGWRGWSGAVVVTACVVALAVGAGLAAAGLALLAVGALVVCLRWPGALGPRAAAALPAGERVVVLGAQVAPLEAVVGGGAVGYVTYLFARHERPRIQPVHWVFVALVAAVAFSIVGPVDTSDRFRELLFWGALGVVFHSVTTHSGAARPRRFLLGGLALATLVEASVALYEYLDRWSERFSALGGAIVYPLPEGTLGHPNALAQFLVLGVLVTVALGLAERRVLRRLAIVTAVAGSLALVVTFSRASWIAIVAGASVYLLERRARRPLLAAGAALALGAAALALLDAGAIGARISSLFSARLGGLYDFRLELVRRAARIVADHPLTGSGHFEEVGVYAGRPDLATHPHNLFLGLAVFFGIPAALAFAGLLLVALRAAWKGTRAATSPDRVRAIGLLAALVALLVNGLFEYPFWNPSLTALVVLVVALPVAQTPAARGNDTAESGPTQPVG